MIIKFPRQFNETGGWTIDTTVLKAVENKITELKLDRHCQHINWEEIEAVLLALEEIALEVNQVRIT
jgi:hypothetical protein